MLSIHNKGEEMKIQKLNMYACWYIENTVEEDCNPDFNSLSIYHLWIQGAGNVSVTNEDYACLEVEQFLNDVIIDFYLK